MPYRVNASLQPSPRGQLPERAQGVFRETFNAAYEARARDRRQEGAAFRIAWARIKRRYERIGDGWVPKA